MNRYIVFLRGVMPTGRTKVPMAEARAALSQAGYHNVRSYIASGNFLVDTPKSPDAVARDIRGLIAQHIGPELEVLVRDAAQLAAILAANPFVEGKPNQVLVTFLSAPAPDDFMALVQAPAGEQVVVAGREIYLHYPNGIGRSKLRLPACVKQGTARNLNTLRKLLAMAQDGGNDSKAT